MWGDDKLPSLFYQYKRTRTHQAGRLPRRDYPLSLEFFYIGLVGFDLSGIMHVRIMIWGADVFVSLLKCSYSFLLFSYTEPTMIETTICLASRLWRALRTHLHCTHFKKVSSLILLTSIGGTHNLLGVLCLPAMYQVNCQLWHTLKKEKRFFLSFIAVLLTNAT